MGTNFYVYIKSPCPTCQHIDDDNRIHLGKRSAGWVFLFRTQMYALPGVKGLTDFLVGKIVYDEYGDQMSGAEFLAMALKTYENPKNKRHERTFNADPKFKVVGGKDWYDGEFS
jgi:hypothetical protein